MKTYVCGICGKEYFDLDLYMKCVSQCGENAKATLKAEAEKARLAKVNEALSKIKEAKKHYEEQLAKFEKEYPAEYKLNFGDVKGVCPSDCKGVTSDDKSETVKVLYKKKNDEEPKIRAIVNGKDVSAEKLLEDPSCKYIAELLGLI